MIGSVFLKIHLCQVLELHVFVERPVALSLVPKLIVCFLNQLVPLCFADIGGWRIGHIMPDLLTVPVETDGDGKLITIATLANTSQNGRIVPHFLSYLLSLSDNA